MSIGQVAREMNLAPSTIRYYEEEQLIPRARRVSGQRVYDDTVFDHLTFVHFARKSGFGIAEIKTLVAGLSPDSPPGDRWRAVADQKLDELDRKIDDLMKMRDQLRRLAGCQCPTLHHFVNDVRRT